MAIGNTAKTRSQQHTNVDMHTFMLTETMEASKSYKAVAEAGWVSKKPYELNFLACFYT